MLFNSQNQSRTLRVLIVACLVATGVTISSATAQEEKEFTVEQKGQVLNYRPTQEVNFDYKFSGKPPKEAIEKAQMQKAEKLFKGKLGYVLADETNRVVRVLIDSNEDRKLDYFSYFKDGAEVYREIDTDYDSKRNEFRWLGAGGTRWGVDRNQDGEIDFWKVISAEEVAFEVFMAIRNRDDARYQRLLITDAEFRSLGLTGTIAADAAKRLDRARKQFGQMVRGQKMINEKAKWINSGNGQPSIAAAGVGLSKDIICHDHASSVFESAAGTDTLALGTLVQIGNVWRLMELPQVVPRGKPIENGGVLFPIVQIDPIPDDSTGGGTVQPQILADLFAKLDKSEKSIDKLNKPGVQMANLQKDRAMIQWDIYKNQPANEKATWLENIGDTVSNAYQIGNYPDGLKFLRSLTKTLKDNNRQDSLDYIRWRMIHADYLKRLDDGDNRQDEVTGKWYYGELEKFSSEFPKSKFAPEALFGIGQNFEVSRQQDLAKARQWYGVCASKHGQTEYGKRAAGALIRLNGRGKPIPFKGKTVDGKVFDISNRTLRGRVVVVFYWQLWCGNQSCNAKGDTAFEVFQDLKSKYKDELVIVSANIESPTTAAKYRDFGGEMDGLFEMHVPGGMEKSPLAGQLGIVSEPTMIVWDKKGNMAEAESGVGDLERIVQRLMKE